MRGFLQDKLSEDHMNNFKNKEKSTVLFSEVVRLGEQYERQLEQFQQSTLNYESRIQTLESRLQSTEQNSITVDKKGDATSQFMNEVMERMEAKMQQVEQNVYFMKADTSKDKENMSRLEIQGLRSNEDFRNLVSTVQGDFQTKLEVKMTDLVNRLLLEQEERLRSVDDVRYQMELKDKIF